MPPNCRPQEYIDFNLPSLEETGLNSENPCAKCFSATANFFSEEDLASKYQRNLSRTS